MFLWFVFFLFLVAFLGIYVFRLKRKITKLQNSFKELLQESRRQTPREQRNKENIYFHLGAGFTIDYMNDVACRFFGMTAEDATGQPASGRLWEDTPANQAYLSSCFHRLQKNPETINSDIVVLNKDRKKTTMRMRIRPILNEILECTGMSIVLKDVSEEEKLRSKLKKLQEKDVLNSRILNETALFQKFEKEFSRCKRYNLDFSIVVLELKDIYDFVCRGIDFETGDRLIFQAGKICSMNAGAKRIAGRFNKTKFAILLPQETRETAAELAQNMYYPLLKMIQASGIDRYNAEMFVLSYTNRKNFNETPDTLLGRVNRHIANALKKREYGIKSSDRNKNDIL